tara:strand:+ start:251 stop:1207 length:957 start_codon:yes stop_codon:yes gene_type:complete
MEKILVTGCSGFIGMHLCQNLLEDGYNIYGIDNMNDYYDTNLKESRLKELVNYSNFSFLKADICDQSAINKIFELFKPSKVVNLAAQVGVRYSIENPSEYIHSNISGFMNVLEACIDFNVQGLIYASSSSVYGGNKKVPFSVEDSVDKPVSIYAATKKCNELLAHSFNSLYGLKSTGLRFFTVYGPWGRPDMGVYLFMEKILNDLEINVFNHGQMKRDFTFIGDIIKGIRASIEKNYSYEIFNLGNNKSVDLMEMIKVIEIKLGKKAKINFMDMQPGDVKVTYADIEHSQKMLGYSPNTGISDGISQFIDWYYRYKDI